MTAAAVKNATLTDIQDAANRVGQLVAAAQITTDAPIIAVERTDDGWELTWREVEQDSRTRGELVTVLGGTKSETVRSLQLIALGLELAGER